MLTKKQYIRLSLVFIAIVGLPAFQTLTRIFPERELNGVYFKKALPRLTWDHWIHFRFQPELNQEVEHRFGFRPFFIRLYNQMDYSLFHQAHGSGVVIGKQGYLYESWFITAHYGQDFIGQDSIGYRIREVKQARDYFRRNGKELLVVVAPGKADYYPEYIPDRLRRDTAATNYSRMVKGMQEAGIPLLDYNSLFIRMKDTTTCPLFPRTGTHWSHYGARLACDTLSRFIGSVMHRPMPRFGLGPAVFADTVINPDDDLERLMNLYFPLRRDPLCYPDVIRRQTEGFSLPSTIVVGDSFFWQMFNLPLDNRMFSNVQFWYYNSTVYSGNTPDSLHTRDLKFPDVFGQTDLIILFVNPSNIQNIGWGFPRRVVRELYQPGWEQEYEKMVREYIRAIHNTPEWIRQIEQDAKAKGMQLDSLIRLNAKYMVDQYLLHNDLF